MLSSDVPLGRGRGSADNYFRLLPSTIKYTLFIYNRATLLSVNYYYMDTQSTQFFELSQQFVEWLQWGRPTPVTRTTIETAEKFNRLILRYTGNFDVTELSQHHILAIRKEMLKKGNALSYIERMLSHLRSFLRYCKAEHGLKVMRPKDIKLPHRKPAIVEYFNHAELEVILEAIDTTKIQGKRLKALTLILLDSGMRISEALSLNRNSINYQKKRAKVLGKGQKEGIVFFHDWSLKSLQVYLDARTDNHEALFASHYDKKNPTRWTPKCVRRYYQQLSRELDIKINPHKFRKTAATFFRQNGGDIHDVQHFLRHSKITTTLFYLGIDYDKLQAAHSQHLQLDKILGDGILDSVT